MLRLPGHLLKFLEVLLGSPTWNVLNGCLPGHPAASWRRRRAVPACLGRQRFPIDPATPPPPPPDQALILKAAKRQRHRLARGADQAGQVLVRQGQADFPGIAVAAAMGFEQFLKQRDNALAVRPEQNVAQPVLDPPPAK